MRPTFKRRVLVEKIGFAKEEMFLFLTEGLVIKKDEKKYPNYLFYFKGKRCWFQYDKVGGMFCCSTGRYWDKIVNEFGDEFNTGFEDVANLTGDLFIKHFHTKTLRKDLMAWFLIHPCRQVERHFNNK